MTMNLKELRDYVRYREGLACHVRLPRPESEDMTIADIEALLDLIDELAGAMSALLAHPRSDDRCIVFMPSEISRASLALVRYSEAGGQK